ncbi:uncharacterized protein LOC131671769 [Phymastichus coffea]|uniref:uncharacterized protein LOC131671769 n=1 Tax=Phymastichus coffea TaxID=108790 RepID=UPI00273CC24D|nr:uncharacterized protein LOC131671769 [Phymastichus coffea]
MLHYCEKLDNLRKRKSLQKTTRQSKLRRIELTATRINSRKQNEKSEGVAYQRNVGINTTNTVISASVLDKVVEINDTASELVFFDLETSGLEESCDILQIAAASSTIEFCTYALPTRNIPMQVTKVNGLSGHSVNLFFNGKKVEAVELNEALMAFSAFLKTVSPSCTLAAHNSSFDMNRLIYAINNKDLYEEFKIIDSSVDTLRVFKMEYPE